jgi:hypothetical protein
MAPNPPAAGGGPPGRGKALSLRSPWTWVIVGGIALAGGALILYRNRKAAASAAGGASTAPVDYSGALGTLQDEIGNLQSSGQFGGGTSTVPVTTPAGGGGTVTGTDTGPSSGGNPPGASGGVTTPGGGDGGGGSSGSTSGSGGGVTTAAPPRVLNGRIVSLTSHGAVIAWDGPGATSWAVTRTGPGSPNGITNIVHVPQAVYSGLASGHNYEIRIQPLVNGQPAGSPGGIDFKTK